MEEAIAWKSCSSCKGGIALGSTYWTCNVSTCNRKRTGLVFCSVSCWDAHLPVARHRDAWAEEQQAPRSKSSESQASVAAKPPPASQPTTRPTRRLVRPQAAPSNTPPAQPDVLVIASRLKEYVRGRSGFNTSDRALGPLSEILRVACDEAIEKARLEGRKTVLDRDIPKP